MRSMVPILFLSLITAGCATTPSFDKISGVTPKTIVEVIECEIIAARDKKKREKMASTSNRSSMAGDKSIAMLDTKMTGLPMLGAKMTGPPKIVRVYDLTNFYAVADLTLQVDEQATLAPSFTHTDVVSKSVTRMFDWGVKLDTQSHRVYTETVQFNINGLSDEKNRCAQRRIGLSLNGTLGIEEVVNMAFGSIDPDDQSAGWPAPDASDTGSGGADPGRGKASGDSTKSKTSTSKAAFGTSIEFNIVGAVTATGPTWTLVHFKGPGKLFSTQRNDTHKVTISFALSPNAAMANNSILSSETLPSSISRRLLLQLQ
jgi:hypothetical protein